MYSAGGPRFPKTKMVTRLPVLQQGHLRNLVPFFSSFGLKQQCAVLKHEIMHVLLEHCGSRQYGKENQQAKQTRSDFESTILSNKPDKEN